MSESGALALGGKDQKSLRELRRELTDAGKKLLKAVGQRTAQLASEKKRLIKENPYVKPCLEALEGYNKRIEAIKNPYLQKAARMAPAVFLGGALAWTGVGPAAMFVNALGSTGVFLAGGALAGARSELTKKIRDKTGTIATKVTGFVISESMRNRAHEWAEKNPGWAAFLKGAGKTTVGIGIGFGLSLGLGYGGRWLRSNVSLPSFVGTGHAQALPKWLQDSIDQHGGNKQTGAEEMQKKIEDNEARARAKAGGTPPTQSDTSGAPQAAPKTATTPSPDIGPGFRIGGDLGERVIDQSPGGPRVLGRPVDQIGEATFQFVDQDLERINGERVSTLEEIDSFSPTLSRLNELLRESLERERQLGRLVSEDLERLHDSAGAELRQGMISSAIEGERGLQERLQGRISLFEGPHPDWDATNLEQLGRVRINADGPSETQGGPSDGVVQPEETTSEQRRQRRLLEDAEAERIGQEAFELELVQRYERFGQVYESYERSMEYLRDHVFSSSGDRHAAALEVRRHLNTLEELARYLEEYDTRQGARWGEILQQIEAAKEEVAELGHVPTPPPQAAPLPSLEQLAESRQGEMVPPEDAQHQAELDDFYQQTFEDILNDEQLGSWGVVDELMANEDTVLGSVAADFDLEADNTEGGTAQQLNRAFHRTLSQLPELQSEYGITAREVPPGSGVFRTGVTGITSGEQLQDAYDELIADERFRARLQSVIQNDRDFRLLRSHLSTRGGAQAFVRALGEEVR